MGIFCPEFGQRNSKKPGVACRPSFPVSRASPFSNFVHGQITVFLIRPLRSEGMLRRLSEMRRNGQGKYNISMCTVKQTPWLLRLVILQLFQTFIIAVFHKIGRYQISFLPCLYSISAAPGDRPTESETRPRGLSIGSIEPERNCSQNKSRTRCKFIVLSIYLLDTCKM